MGRNFCYTSLLFSSIVRHRVRKLTFVGVISPFFKKSAKTNTKVSLLAGNTKGRGSHADTTLVVAFRELDFTYFLT